MIFLLVIQQVSQRLAAVISYLLTCPFNVVFLVQVEGQPFTVVTAPAHRTSPGEASTENGSLQVALDLFCCCVCNDFLQIKQNDQNTQEVNHDLLSESWPSPLSWIKITENLNAFL